MPTKNEIFFSYAWGDEKEEGESREKIVNDLYNSLIQEGFTLVRDKYDLGYKGFISDFMARIGRGKNIIVVISKKFVKSPYCMFELYEIARNSNFDKYQFSEKVVPILIDFIDFSRPKILNEYFAYWESEYMEWDGLIKSRSTQLSKEQFDRFDKIKMIHQNFGKLADWLIDMNTLSPTLLSKDNFNEIKKAIQNATEQSDGPDSKRLQNSDYNQIRRTIAEGKMEMALNLLWERIQNKDSDSLNQFILIRSRYNKLKQDNLNGILASDIYNLENNRITFAVLEIISVLENDTEI